MNTRREAIPLSRRGKYITNLKPEQVHELKLVVIDALLSCIGADLKVKQFVRELTHPKSKYKSRIEDTFGDCGTPRQRMSCMVGVVDKLIGEGAVVANSTGLWTGDLSAYRAGDDVIDLTEAPATINA